MYVKYVPCIYVNLWMHACMYMYMYNSICICIHIEMYVHIHLYSCSAPCLFMYLSVFFCFVLTERESEVYVLYWSNTVFGFLCFIPNQFLQQIILEVSLSLSLSVLAIFICPHLRIRPFTVHRFLLISLLLCLITAV